MYLLDTNICIYFMKNTFPGLSKKILTSNPSDLLISSITVFELEYGAEKSNWSERNRNKLAMFLSPFNIVPFNTEDAIIAGRIRGYLAQKGTPIGPYDVMIAAQCLSREAAIVTHNTKEFGRVQGLTMEDWTGILS